MDEKKKKIFTAIFIIVSFFICASIIYYFFINKSSLNIQISKNLKEENILYSNAISMMYETEIGSGEYQITNDTTWPSSGYIFNERLSGCENGGTLSWDEETKRVIMATNISDKCYVYFDKYEIPKINNVNITKTYNSISLTVDATKGNNNIVKYYYSNNDGSSYVNSTSNTYSFSGLTPNLEYKIKVYAEDNLGYTSSVYETTVTTNTYTNPSVTNVTTSDITTSSITLNVIASGGTNSVVTYYYSKDNGSSYVSSTSNIYTFSGLTKGTTYNFKVYVKDSVGYSSSAKSISATTDNTVLLANYIKSLYTSQGINGIYYHDSSLANGASDNSYRYAGASPNNYVCFGSDASSCPNDNLYRIIGVFGSEVKLIKSTTYGNYVWDSGDESSWSTSDIKNTLNTTYYNNLGTAWQNKIATVTWYLGGISSSVSYPYKIYDFERGVGRDNTKIGLIYLSDYGFAATPDYWLTTMYYFNSATSSNWLYLGLNEWTINSGNMDGVLFFIESNGNVSSVNPYNYYAVRPTFYLNADVIYLSGDGTKSSPFRIS